MQQLTLYIAGKQRACWPLTMPNDTRLPFEANARIREAYVSGIVQALTGQLARAGIKKYNLMLEAMSNFPVEMEVVRELPRAMVIPGIPSRLQLVGEK